MKSQSTFFFLLLSLFNPLIGPAQSYWKYFSFTKADTLRGSLRPERTCYDVTYYELDLRIDPEQQRLEGFVDIHYTALTDFNRLQIDLFQNMKIDRILWQEELLSFERKENAVFIQFPQQTTGARGVFRIYYGGRPKTALNPPWDGGFIWTEDDNGKPWAAVACQGIGASLWWPNKDHLSDEPDSISIRITVPKDLRAIANGRLRSISLREEGICYEWFVSYPINNYNVSVNMGDYVHVSDRYPSANGAPLSLDYYVLRGNEAIADRHFGQVKSVLACLEKYLGPYPFPEDGFALIEAPYNGMEHQSGIAYGNRFLPGYLGSVRVRDIDFDYVIMHEAAHEYFGNSISCTDMAEIWLHESFTTYMESVYVEDRHGYENALKYLASQRQAIQNQVPILGPSGVNWDNWDSSDNYNKGAWVLHTLRSLLQNDEQWFALLRGFYERYRYRSVTTDEWIQYVEEFAGQDFRTFFQQYLHYPKLPRLACRFEPSAAGLWLRFRWEADVREFNMPILVRSGERTAWLKPTTEWQETTLPGFSRENFQVAEELFLVETDY